MELTLHFDANLLFFYSFYLVTYYF